MAPGTGNCGVGLCQQLLGVFGLLSGCSPAVCVCLGSLREDPEHTVVFYLISLVHSPGAGCWLETSPHRLSESASHHWWFGYLANHWGRGLGLISWWITFPGNWSLLIWTLESGGILWGPVGRNSQMGAGGVLFRNSALLFSTLSHWVCWWRERNPCLPAQRSSVNVLIRKGREVEKGPCGDGSGAATSQGKCGALSTQESQGRISLSFQRECGLLTCFGLLASRIVRK